MGFERFLFMTQSSFLKLNVLYVTEVFLINNFESGGMKLDPCIRKIELEMMHRQGKQEKTDILAK